VYFGTGWVDLRVDCLAGKEGLFTPACEAIEVGGVKPPFLACEFNQCVAEIYLTLIDSI
jgi:hypothetical protein